MYCEKCHRQSPDNFDSCAYCSEPFKKEEEQKPSRFVKKETRKRKLSRKTITLILIGVAFMLCVAAIITGVVKGEKPESTVKALSEAIEANDRELYYGLFDNQIKEYKKENWYFDDDETFRAMTEPLEKSVAFYSESCGEKLRVSYKITDTIYLTEAQLEKLNDMLEDTYGYTKLPTSAAKLDFEINVSGENGEYKSIYKDFYCIKIGGKWYRIETENILSNETTE